MTLSRACLAFAFSLFAASFAMAGSLSVSPIRVELSSTQRSLALEVRNEGDQPSVVQAQLVAWSQDNNEDKLEPTTDLLASPPIFTVPAGKVQILRIALRRAPDATAERSYRVLITEVPGKPQPGFTGAQFALKISIPIFVEATSAKTAAKLEWSVARNANGDVALTTTNSGTRHIQVHSVELLNETAAIEAGLASMWYVLPGQRRTVIVKPIDGRAIPAGRIRVRAESDAGPLSADIVLGPN